MKMFSFKPFAMVAAVGVSIIMSSAPSFASDLSVSGGVVSGTGQSINGTFSPHNVRPGGIAIASNVQRLLEVLAAVNEAEDYAAFANLLGNSIVFFPTSANALVESGVYAAIALKDLGDINDPPVREALEKIIADVNAYRSPHGISGVEATSLRQNILAECRFILSTFGSMQVHTYHLSVKK